MPLFRRSAPNGSAPNGSAPESEDCAAHSPCRQLLEIPPRELDSRLRLMLTPVSETGRDDVSAHLNTALAGRLVAMDAQRDPRVVPHALVIPVHFLPHWNVTSRELLDRALANGQRQELDISGHQLDADTVMYTVGRRDLVDATQLLRLDQVLGRELPFGAYVTVPKVNAVTVLPLTKAAHVSMLPDSLGLLHSVASQGPGAPSMDAFWFHDGKLDPLNAQMRDGRMERFLPPEGFEERMAQLPG